MASRFGSSKSVLAIILLQFSFELAQGAITSHTINSKKSSGVIPLLKCQAKETTCRSSRSKKIPHRPYNLPRLEEIKGGGFWAKETEYNEHDPGPANSGPEINALNLGVTATAIVTILLIALRWEALILSISVYFDREKLCNAIIETLNKICEKGNKGLLIYSFGFCFWETCGLPTSVVETAAGMTFGFRKGLFASFFGKTCGSIFAFILGRSLLSYIAEKYLKESETFQLIDKSVARHPIKSSLIIRYSVFPQLFKNFGLSLTKPVTLPIFIFAIVVHGLPFSLLWAALGEDSYLRLRAIESGESFPANIVLNGLLLFVSFVGFVVSPIVTGWWLADLRKEL